MQEREIIYFIKTANNLAYYSLQQSFTSDCYGVDPTYVLPYITKWPQLLSPQTIH
jgi:hypothetical protein